MTRKSRRELERCIDDLEAPDPAVSLSEVWEAELRGKEPGISEAEFATLLRAGEV